MKIMKNKNIVVLIFDAKINSCKDNEYTVYNLKLENGGN